MRRALLPAIAIGLLLLLGSASRASLVAHFPLDEDPASDGSAIVDVVAGNNGTLATGEGAANKATAGMINGAVAFDGVDDGIDAGDAAIFNRGAGDLTLSAWFNTTWLPGDTVVGTIANKGGSFAGGKRYMINYVKEGQLQLTFDDDSTFLASNSPGTYSDGNWHMVALVRDNGDPGKEAKLYVDAEPVVAAPYGGGSIDSPNGRPFTIGQAVEEGDGAETFFFNGVIDDVRLYDEALSPQAIADLFTDGGGVIPEGDPNLIRFDLGFSGRATLSSQWNNVSDDEMGFTGTGPNSTEGTGLRVVDAVNDARQITKVDFNMLDDFGGTNSVSPPSTSPVGDALGYPQSAQSDSFFLNTPSADTPTAQFRLEGLNPGQEYELTLFGWRGAGGSRLMDITVADTTETLSASFDDGSNNRVDFTGVQADANGYITVDAAAVGSDFGYLGVVEIRGEFTLIPEPNTLVLALIGFLGLAFIARRRRQ